MNHIVCLAKLPYQSYSDTEWIIVKLKLLRAVSTCSIGHAIMIMDLDKALILKYRLSFLFLLYGVIKQTEFQKASQGERYHYISDRGRIALFLFRRWSCEVKHQRTGSSSQRWVPYKLIEAQLRAKDSSLRRVPYCYNWTLAVIAIKSKVTRRIPYSWPGNFTAQLVDRAPSEPHPFILHYSDYCTTCPDISNEFLKIILSKRSHADDCEKDSVSPASPELQ